MKDEGPGFEKAGKHAGGSAVAARKSLGNKSLAKNQCDNPRAQKHYLFTYI